MNGESITALLPVPPPSGRDRPGTAVEQAPLLPESDTPSEAQQAPAPAPAEKAASGPTPNEIARQRISQAMDEAERSGFMRPLQMRLSVDPETHQTIVKIVDSRTDKVVRTIPAEEQVAFARRLDQFLGLLFDKQG